MPSSSHVPARQHPSSVWKVFVVEDHPIYLHGLKQLIENSPGFSVCGTAVDSREALEILRHHAPDVAIVDIALPGINGIELVKLMKAERPDLAVLVVSMHTESQYMLRALRAGALGYVMKAEAISQVVHALHKILAGEMYVSPELGERLIFQTIQTPQTEADSPVHRLTTREREVLELIGRGFGTREIAQQLNMSVKTVETHRGHMRDKLAVADSSELVRFAMDWVVRNE